VEYLQEYPQYFSVFASIWAINHSRTGFHWENGEMHPYLTIVSHIYIIYPCSPTTKPHAPSPLKRMCLRGSTATARASASRWALSSAQLRNGCRASSPMLGDVRIMLGDRRCAVGLGQPFQVAYNEIFKVQYYVSIYILWYLPWSKVCDVFPTKGDSHPINDGEMTRAHHIFTMAHISSDQNP